MNGAMAGMCTFCKQPHDTPLRNDDMVCPCDCHPPETGGGMANWVAKWGCGQPEDQS